MVSGEQHATRSYDSTSAVRNSRNAIGPRRKVEFPGANGEPLPLEIYEPINPIGDCVVAIVEGYPECQFRETRRLQVHGDGMDDLDGATDRRVGHDRGDAFESRCGARRVSVDGASRREMSKSRSVGDVRTRSGRAGRGVAGDVCRAEQSDDEGLIAPTRRCSSSARARTKRPVSTRPSMRSRRARLPKTSQ